MRVFGSDSLHHHFACRAAHRVHLKSFRLYVVTKIDVNTWMLSRKNAESYQGLGLVQGILNCYNAAL